MQSAQKGQPISTCGFYDKYCEYQLAKYLDSLIQPHILSNFMLNSTWSTVQHRDETCIMVALTDRQLRTGWKLPSVEDGHVSNEVYRKPTFTGLLLNANDVWPRKWKLALIHCLLHRAYSMPHPFHPQGQCHLSIHMLAWCRHLLHIM